MLLSLVSQTIYCGFNICQNDGNCTIQPSGLIKCICKNGYIGNNCEIVANICAQKNCSNQGICMPLSNGGYQCLCNSKLIFFKRTNILIDSKIFKFFYWIYIK